MNQKTAILLRGLSRNYQKTYESLFKHIPNVDTFIHTWDITGVRTDKSYRFSYSQEITNIDNLQKAYNPKNIIVESQSEFFEKNINKIKENLRRLTYNPDDELTLKYGLYGLHTQMYGFEQTVKSFLKVADPNNYQNIFVIRFDCKLPKPLPLSKLGTVIVNDRWHGKYYRDFFHLIHPQDISKYSRIYSDLIEGKFSREYIEAPFKKLPNAERYYENFAKSVGLNCMSSGMGSGGLLVR
jgi:hypothetical protein